MDLCDALLATLNSKRCTVLGSLSSNNNFLNNMRLFA